MIGNNTFRILNLIPKFPNIYNRQQYSKSKKRLPTAIDMLKLHNDKPIHLEILYSKFFRNTRFTITPIITKHFNLILKPSCIPPIY